MGFQIYHFGLYNKLLFLSSDKSSDKLIKIKVMKCEGEFNNQHDMSVGQRNGNRTHDLPNTAAVPAWCSGGHRFNSCQGLTHSHVMLIYPPSILFLSLLAHINNTFW